MKKLVKTIHIMMMLTTVVFFTSIPLGAEAKDCSHVTKLHKKLLCKAGKDVSNTSTTSDTTKKVKKAKKEKKPSKLKQWNEENKTLVDLIKKTDKAIKNKVD